MSSAVGYFSFSFRFIHSVERQREETEKDFTAHMAAREGISESLKSIWDSYVGDRGLSHLLLSQAYGRGI